MSGHIGAKGNFYCRKCNVGGTQKNKETDEGFHSLFYVLCLHFQQLPIANCSLFFQPGEPRSSAETLAGVKNQVKLACLGVTAHVKDAQTNSGIKDAFTQSWIDDLIGRARVMQKAHPTRPVAEIQAELMVWANDHEDKIYNPFLTLEGALIPEEHRYQSYSKRDLKVLTPRATPLLKFSTQFS